MHSVSATHRELELRWRRLQYFPARGSNRQLSTHARSSLSPVRAGVSAGQSKCTMTPPEAAIWLRYASLYLRLSPTAVVINTASGSAACHATQKSTVVHRVARRIAPCTVLGAHRRRGVPRLLCSRRGAGGRVTLVQGHAAHRGSQVLPNPSFKPSPNGVPRGPGRRYAVHFRHPGPRVTPLVPA